MVRPDGAAVPVSRTAGGRDGLAALRATPGRALVAVDYDGTLAPIVADPAAARAHPRVLPALVRLAGIVGQVAVVTGRPPLQAVALGGLDAVPGLVVLGHYGYERWRDGQHTTPDLPPGLEQVRGQLPAVLARAGADGATVEDKGLALAVHTRGASDPDATLERLRGPLTELAAAHHLVLEPGRAVLELRPGGVDKGVALRRLVDEHDPSVVVFAGDDLGDLPAFDAVEALRADGLPGLLVCSGSAEVSAVAERADVVVDGPAGVAALLEALADELGGQPD